MASVSTAATPLVPTSAQLHHRCQFDICSKTQAEVAWAEIVRTTRKWLVYKLKTEEQLLGAWFFKGGSWNGSRSTRVTVTTACEVGDGTADCPQFWSLRYEHPCAEISVRQWRTDIGVTANDKKFRFSISTSYWIVPGYFGQEPPTPLPTAPGVIGALFRSKDWRCEAGSEVLAQTPTVLKAGDGNALIERLTDPGRACPLVLVSCSGADGSPMVDTAKLSKALAGSARVYVADSTDVHKEWDYLLPRGFRCQSGMIRVYQPAVRFDIDRDARRHRYISEELIRELPEGQVQEMIVRGIARRANVAGYFDVTSIEDVEARRREIRIRELRVSARGQEKDEWVALLEEDNGTLRDKVSAMAGQLQEAVSKSEVLDDQIVELNKEKARLEYSVKDYTKKCNVAAEAVRVAETKLSAITSLSKLPGSVREVAEKIQAFFPERIAFTERGLASTVSRSESMVPLAWECLWAIATVLYDMFFVDNTKGVDLERRFKERSGFELAMSEGRNTKKDKKFMELRRDVYKGSEIEITPHVKIGNREPRLLRVHFCIEREQRIVVVGHCGGHLDNFSSRKY